MRHFKYIEKIDIIKNSICYVFYNHNNVNEQIISSIISITTRNIFNTFGENMKQNVKKNRQDCTKRCI